jgi:hypothetical protein
VVCGRLREERSPGARVRVTATEAARADLEVSQRGPLPAVLKDRSDLPERAAALLEWVWTQTVLPGWPRRRRVIEADIVARTRQLSDGGWAAALNDMRPAGCGGWGRAGCRSTPTQPPARDRLWLWSAWMCMAEPAGTAYVTGAVLQSGAGATR